MQLRRRKIQNRANARLNDTIDDGLSIVGRNREHRYQGVVPLHIAFEIGHVADNLIAPLLANFGRIVVVHPDHAKAAIVEAVIIGQRRANLAGPNDNDPPFASQAEDRSKLCGQFVHRVPQATFAKGSKR